MRLENNFYSVLGRHPSSLWKSPEYRDFVPRLRRSRIRLRVLSHGVPKRRRASGSHSLDSIHRTRVGSCSQDCRVCGFLSPRSRRRSSRSQAIQSALCFHQPYARFVEALRPGICQAAEGRQRAANDALLHCELRRAGGSQATGLRSGLRHLESR